MPCYLRAWGTNLVTGMATATTEGDPVLAIGGEVPLDDRYKHTHQ